MAHWLWGTDLGINILAKLQWQTEERRLKHVAVVSRRAGRGSHDGYVDDVVARRDGEHSSFYSLENEE